MQPPPPPYISDPGPPPFPGTNRPRPTLTTLPAHILLNIVYLSFPQTPLVDQDTPERQRKTLYWLSHSLRLVNRVLYVACMHVLRSTHLPAYGALIRPPYSSDPFPLLSPHPEPIYPAPAPPYAPSSSSQQRTPSPLNTIQRETATLDLFIALKVREDVWADDSELHLERDESFKDLFDLIQPRSRLEDLVRIYGIRDGVVTLSPKPPTAPSARPTPPLPSPSSSSPTTPTSLFSSLSLSFSKKSQQKPQPHPRTPQLQPQPIQITPIPFHLLSISFSPRNIGLILHPHKRTIVSTPRTRDEPLETAARRLVKELRAWLAEGG